MSEDKIEEVLVVATTWVRKLGSEKVQRCMCITLDEASAVKLVTLLAHDELTTKLMAGVTEHIEHKAC